MSKRHKKACTTLNNFNSAFNYLIGIPVGIMSSAIGLKICVKTAGIKSISQSLKKEKGMKKKYC